MNKITKLLVAGLILGLLLSACESLPFELPWLSQTTPTATLLPGEEDETPTPEVTQTADVTPEPVTQLVLWVPPEMDPELETEASRIFENRLQLFSDLNDGIQIDVRVKAFSGPGGLLDALTATSAAAPEALPDVIALSRSDLETAALKNLVFPLEGLTEIPDDTDWFSFTRQMALLQGGTFGLPFAADSLALVYRPTALEEDFPGSWSALLEAGVPLAFSADSDQALFPLAYYLAEGGLIQDSQRRPTLEVDPLTGMFRFLEDGIDAGIFSENLLQFQTTGQVWTAFRDGQTDLAITWVSNYLQEGPADAALAPLYPISNGAVSMGTGIAWAVATPQEHRQPVAVDLAEFLVQPDFLREWSMSAGYLPTRPSSLEGWQDQSLRSSLSQIALMTQLRPSNDILTTIGPIMREGVRQILQGTVDPAQAAQVAVESLEEQ